MIQHFHMSGDAVKDYTLAGVLTTSPLWGTYLAELNIWLTTLGLVLGVWLAVRRLIRDHKHPKD